MEDWVEEFYKEKIEIKDKKTFLEKEIEELEKLDKPIVHTGDFEIKEIEEKLFLVWFQGKFNGQTIVTHKVEEKGNILITDDFIFVKEC